MLKILFLYLLLWVIGGSIEPKSLTKKRNRIR